MADLDRERAALAGARERLLSCAHVVATGIGYKTSQGRKTSELSLVCSVIRKLPASQLSRRDLIPGEVEGVHTDVIETGRIRALQDRTARHRPAPGGVSIGHRDITAGTLGCLVRHQGEIAILSNNHVLANSNDAAQGDAILQPGPVDGGTVSRDRIAELTAFIPIAFQEAPSDCPFASAVIALLNAGCRAIGSRTRYRIVRPRPEHDNLVDAAVARPLNLDDVSAEILEIGQITEVGSGEIGMDIQKSGRTTGLTAGTIDQVDVVVNVQYGNRMARFTDQLLAGPMSQGGDSGSAVLDTNNRLVGLLFAGGENSTIINRIENVFEVLDLEL